MKSFFRRVRRMLKPWVVREYAPDGRTFYGYGGRVERYWTRMGAQRAARELSAWFAEVNQRQAETGRPLFRWQVQFRAKAGD